MKILLTAIAFAIATPAAAQPSADAHAGHTAMQSQAGTSGQASHQGSPGANVDHSKMDHSKMDHSKHGNCCAKQSDGKGMPCCDKMKAGGREMDCCGKTGAAKGASDPHSGHDVSKQ